MAGEGGNIIRNVFGKSYKEAEHIMKDASKGALDFKSPQENTFYGKKGGKKLDEYKAKKDILPLRVLAVKCYEDFECKKEVTIIEKDKRYFYKVTQYNRTPNKSDLKNLKWGIQYDNGTISNALQVTGEEKISHFVSKKDTTTTKVRVYAFFKAPNKNASVEVYLQHLRLVITDKTIGYSIIRIFDIANKGIGTTNPACIVNVYSAELILMKPNEQKKLYSFGVTRDGWQKIDEIDKDTYYFINRAFEPKDSADNVYNSIDYIYPNQIKGWIQFPAFKLSQNNSLKLAAEPIERNTKLDGKTPIPEKRDDINFAKDVMIHIGGHYLRGGTVYMAQPGGVKVGVDWLGGSLGCFGFVESVDIKSSIALAQKAHDDDDFDDSMSDKEWYKTVETINTYRKQYGSDLLIQVVKRTNAKKSTTYKKEDILWE
ncbi:hypothetical protein [Chryseobacterium sp. OSA05B]|uniref:hypothetical protein n=1 Tax=Chryseobacterium sp. OSA05B TaxID=2862650 RepID=UPI001CBE558D|nr:hypothetical protein [Chryseobacterium sp. OSA05B]